MGIPCADSLLFVQVIGVIPGGFPAGVVGSGYSAVHAGCSPKVPDLFCDPGQIRLLEQTGVVIDPCLIFFRKQSGISCPHIRCKKGEDEQDRQKDFFPDSSFLKLHNSNPPSKVISAVTAAKMPVQVSVSFR